MFLPDVVAPAEVPVEMNSFKSQQHRWAKGSIQTCLKLMPQILRSNQPIGVKAEAFFHLSANFNYLLMSVLSVLMFPAMWVRYNMGWYEMLLIDVPLFAAATLSVCNFYIVSQRELYPRLASAPEVPAVPDVDRHRPVREQHAGGARGDVRQAERVRAHAEVRHRARRRRVGREEVPPDRRRPADHRGGARACISPARSSTRWPIGIYGTLPFLMLFQVGFLYTGLLSILQQYTGENVMLKTPEVAK